MHRFRRSGGKSLSAQRAKPLAKIKQPAGHNQSPTMKYYFFKTVRDGSRNRLNPLPFQTASDGTAIIQKLNTQVAAGGMKLREAYPIGTVFCSSEYMDADSEEKVLSKRCGIESSDAKAYLFAPRKETGSPGAKRPGKS